jgi:hypothetical protein
MWYRGGAYWQCCSYLGVHDEAEALRELALAAVERQAHARQLVRHGAPLAVRKLVELAEHLLRRRHPALPARNKGATCGGTADV